MVAPDPEQTMPAARAITLLAALPFLAIAFTSSSPAAAISASVIGLILLLPNLIAWGIAWSQPKDPAWHGTTPPADSVSQETGQPDAPES